MGTRVVDDWLEADGLILLEAWARDGYTLQEIATRIGISVDRLRQWMMLHGDIKLALNNGRELVDYKVENALLRAALGYKTKDVKVVTQYKFGKVIGQTKETIVREAAPNVGACQVWLYNRLPKKWKNAKNQNALLDELDANTSIHITVERASPARSEGDDGWDEEGTNAGVVLRGKTQQEKEQDAIEHRLKEREAVQSMSSDEADFLREAKERPSPIRHELPKAPKAVQRDRDTARLNAPQSTTHDARDVWPDDWEDDV